MKKIILCADDYGQSAAISDGIFDLAMAGRLSATSCLTESEYWLDPRNRINELRGRIDIGLHFNLTHPFSNQLVPAKSLQAVLGASLRAQIDSRLITKTLHFQLDRFEQVMKSPPDFVDGHQHVHIFPGIRAVVLRELSRRYRDCKPYVRSVNPPWINVSDRMKSAFLKLLGIGFTKSAANFGISTNCAFAGIYSLEPNADFPKLMQGWLLNANQGDLLMCHPGNESDDRDDPIRMTRPIEKAFLASDKFADLLKQKNLQLTRFAEMGTTG